VASKRLGIVHSTAPNFARRQERTLTLEREVPVTTVGIIANPVSGKDIRRLVAHGSVFDNQEKVRIVRRLLMGLEAVGVRRVVYMPDYYAIVDRALRGCSPQLELVPIPMELENSQDDSTRAGRWIEDQGVGCVLVLGGDGTCRAVAKGLVEVPMLPISTGTNNVFPYLIEATIAGLAAGLVASGRVPKELGAYRAARLEVLEQTRVVDSALVDVAVYNDRFIGSRAIWDVAKVAKLFLTRCSPASIGLSSIGGQLLTLAPAAPQGLYLELGYGATVVTAAIAPGLLQAVRIGRSRLLQVNETVPVGLAPCVLALDGERELEVHSSRALSVRYSAQGPYVVDVAQTMSQAQRLNLMVQRGPVEADPAQ